MKFSTLVLLFLTFLCSGSIFAKTLKLYEEPKESAKVVSTLNSDDGLIPIFTPEKSEWMKVANPKNGDVGWVQMKDLGDGSKTEFTFTQRYMNTGSNPQTFQVIQYGGPQKMTPDQIQNLVKQDALEQQKIQDNFNKSMQQMINDMKTLYHWKEFNNQGMPMIMPVIIIPSENFPQSVKGSKNKHD